MSIVTADNGVDISQSLADFVGQSIDVHCHVSLLNDGNNKRILLVTQLTYPTLSPSYIENEAVWDTMS